MIMTNSVASKEHDTKISQGNIFVGAKTLVEEDTPVRVVFGFKQMVNRINVTRD
jgi:hypothetical protein